MVKSKVDGRMTFRTVVVETVEESSLFRVTGVYEMSETVLECSQVLVDGMNVGKGRFTLTVNDGWILAETGDGGTLELTKTRTVDS